MEKLINTKKFQSIADKAYSQIMPDPSEEVDTVLVIYFPKHLDKTAVTTARWRKTDLNFASFRRLAFKKTTEVPDTAFVVAGYYDKSEKLLENHTLMGNVDAPHQGLKRNQKAKIFS